METEKSEKDLNGKSVVSGKALNGNTEKSLKSGNTISEKTTEAWAVLSDKFTKSYNDLTSGKADTLLIGFDTTLNTYGSEAYF